VLHVRLVHLDRHDRRVAWITLHGPLVSFDQADQLLDVTAPLSEGTTAVIDLRDLSAMSIAGVAALRGVLEVVVERGDPVLVVCDDVDHLTRLALGEVDALAPVLSTGAQTDALIADAA
jgi:hypothetical protein